MSKESESFDSDAEDRVEKFEQPPQEENETRLTERTRKQSEKGLEYYRDLKRRNYRKCSKEIQRQLDRLDMSWTDISDVKALRDERLKLEEARKGLENAKDEYSSLVDGETSDEVQDFERLNKQAQDLRTKIGERIFELEKKELASVSSRSRKSSSSVHSRSTKSNSSNHRLKAAAEVAKREVELKFAKLETQMKLEKQRKECEIEELQRAKEFERAKAEAEAIENAEKEEMPEFSLLDNEPPSDEFKEQRVKDYVSTLYCNSSMDMTIPYDLKETKLSSKNPFRESNVFEQPTEQATDHARGQNLRYNYEESLLNYQSAPCKQESSKNPFRESDVFEQPTDHARGQNLRYSYEEPLLNYQSTPCKQGDITQVIAESMQAARMPPPNLTVFSGNPIEWPTWKSAFENIVERRAINSSEKILYLLQYLSGPPRKIVEGYQFVSSPNAYQEAKRVLQKRFGHPSVVAEAFRNKLEGWPKINPKDGEAMREYADFLKTCELAMISIEDLETLSKEHENKKLLRALPSWAHQRWGSRVREYQQRHGDSKFPPFSDFVSFVTDLAEVECLPVLSGLDKAQHARDDRKSVFRQRSFTRNTAVRSFATTTAENPALRTASPSKSCRWCKGTHDLEVCQTFETKPMSVRKQFIIKSGLCFRCLEHGHIAKTNKCSKKINCKICDQDHPTCLHVDQVSNIEDKSEMEAEEEEADSKCTSVCSIEGQDQGQDQSLIVPVWVSSQENPNVESLTYALIDCQSNATFMTEKLRKELKVEGVESQLLLSTMHQDKEMIDCRKVKNLMVRNYKRDINIPLPKVFTRNKIPFKSSQIPKPEVAERWSHLKVIASELMPYRADLEVGLLIGTNCPKAIKPREIIPGADEDPYGIKTDLGWGIVGRVCQSAEETEAVGVWTNRTMAVETVESIKSMDTQSNTRFAFETRAKEVFCPSQVKEMFESDFSEKTQDKDAVAPSVEDKRFLEIVEKGIHQRRDGHYELPLPLKSDELSLPDNRSQALRRLQHLKSRFKRDNKYYKDYVEFMDQMIKNCAERVPLDEYGAPVIKPKVNYVAHHGVYHPKKKDKIRVVFDCSAQHQGTSLNQHLLQGPDLTNNLVGVLCRFRQESIAITCDVEGMFHQFYVNEEDRDLLRFLWWKDGDFESEPIEYRMKVHLFGAVSSPGCANFAFKRAAEDGEFEFGSDAANFFKHDFYVDDGLKSVRTESAAKALIKDSQAICKKAGLRLHKFTSNSKEVIQEVPPQDRAKGLQELDFQRDPLPIERTLGITWCVETDSFQFRIVIQDRPLTRRGVLSTVSSVYDPLGFVSPLILVGKQILQSLCRENVDWHEPIPDHLLPRWEHWRAELHTLEQLKIQRCYKPKGFGRVKTVQLHHFSDASLDGYGQCSYLRLKDEDDKVHCSLVMGKARVAPLKAVTVPRLELTAAVVSVRIGSQLKKELEYEGMTETFWTDSQVVLGYIKNTSKRFHIFVGNRVQEIHDHSHPDQWRHVKTESNPADAASRGLTAYQLVHNSQWLSGPEFLWKENTDEAYPEPASLYDIHPSDPEVKKVLATNAKECLQSHLESKRLNSFSSWQRAKRAVARCIQLKARLGNRELCEEALSDKSNTQNQKMKQISVDELKVAEREILRGLQHEHFQEEIKTVRSLKFNGEFMERNSAKVRNHALKTTSTLYRLDPFVDEHGILRVGGRLRRASIPEEIKHPVILPKRSHITMLIVRYCHESIKHQGSGMTLNELRQRGYWIIGGASAVSNYTYRCTTCRKTRAPVQQQKMADLPEDRLEPAPPFTFSAVDYFGPFLIKEGRKQTKRYGVLFTCMASRAVHLETSNTLDTDSYINALRRFLAERGPVRQMRSDRGTNFVGANHELAEAMKEIDEDKVHQALLKENCDFIPSKMNVPYASHMGGVWERQIKTVKSVLAVLLRKAGTQLDDEGFRTLIKEVQCIVNSRPLTTVIGNAADAPEPLTPNHLLTMKTKVVMPPPGVFQREDLYSRKRWRTVQHLANEFWYRWKREFLQTLQTRSKWIKPHRNMKIGDIVLLKDENLPRRQWRLARVHETLPSTDGLVRKVRLAMATSELDKKGRRLKEIQILERPVQRLVILLTSEEDQGVPTEESSKTSKTTLS